MECVRVEMAFTRPLAQTTISSTAFWSKDTAFIVQGTFHIYRFFILSLSLIPRNNHQVLCLKVYIHMCPTSSIILLIHLLLH